MNKHSIELDQFITPDGIVFDLNDSAYKAVLSMDGHGLPPIEYITQSGPFQHGSTPYDFRLLPRIVQVGFYQRGCNRLGYWDNRSTLINMLRPNRLVSGAFRRGTLRKILTDGTTRDLDVVIDNGPTFAVSYNGDQLDQGTGFIESLRFIAHDPIFYDPNQVCLVWTLLINNQLILPFTFPFVLGSSALNDDLTFTYNGTWLSYPVIRLTGPLNGTKITQLNTGDFIKMNSNIPGGRVVTITLDYGNKTVVDNLGNNLIGTISADSDLTTFAIQPDPIVAGGVNTINVTATGANANSAVELAFFTKYIGF